MPGTTSLRSPRLADLRRHLVETALAGWVQTPPNATVANCQKLVEGDPDYTFGLSDWQTADLAEALAAVAAVCGTPPPGAEPDGPGWIDPDGAVEAVAGQGSVLRRHARDRSGVLLATGHPTGLLGHYLVIARALAGAGCRLLTALDDSWVGEGDRRRGVRYVGGVACVRTGGDVVHSHRATYMEAILDALDEAGQRPDLVLGDHGMAGAAIERGIETLGIADVNDPALFLAQARGRTASVLGIDDNLAPRLYEPVTAAMLEGVGR